MPSDEHRLPNIGSPHHHHSCTTRSRGPRHPRLRKGSQKAQDSRLGSAAGGVAITREAVRISRTLSRHGPLHSDNAKQYLFKIRNFRPPSHLAKERPRRRTGAPPLPFGPFFEIHTAASKALDSRAYPYRLLSWGKAHQQKTEAVLPSSRMIDCPCCSVSTPFSKGTWHQLRSALRSLPLATNSTCRAACRSLAQTNNFREEGSQADSLTSLWQQAMATHRHLSAQK